MKKGEAFKKLYKLKKEDKVLLLTHTDADGAGPAILLAAAGIQADVQHCTNAAMSAMIRRAVCSQETAVKYDVVIITDISCTDADAAIIDERKCVNTVLLDHHVSASTLNRYGWARVLSETLDDTISPPEDRKEQKREHSSGTSLLYDYLDFCGLAGDIPNQELTSYLVHMITGYDTWDWMNAFAGDDAFKTANRLFWICGIDIYEERMTERLMDAGATSIYTETDGILFRIEEAKISNYLDMVRRGYHAGTLKKDEGDYSFVLCYAHDYLSDVFADMKRLYDVDLYIINTGTRLSIRTNRNDIDLGGMTKALGGGGHMGAGGVPIPEWRLNGLTEKVLKGELEFT